MLVKYKACPTCPIPTTELGSGKVLPPRDLEPILKALSTFQTGEYRAFEAACVDVGIKAVAHPFWEILPYVHIYRSITPDVLSQLYQGLIKHLVAWLQEAFKSSKIDARCSCMPPNHNVCIFKKGLSVLSRVLEEEHQDICHLLLGLIVDLHLSSRLSTLCLIQAVRAMLDFLYITQFPVHSDEMLLSMNEALAMFHANMEVFVELAICNKFNLLKLHNISHYLYYIELFGTTDNYSTKVTERLHIDYMKDVYQARNKKDEYSQMTVWLEQREKIYRHDRFVRWHLNGQRPANDIVHFLHFIEPRNASVNSVSFDHLADDYGVYDIQNALASYIAKTHNHSLTGACLERATGEVHFPLQSRPVYHKFWLANPDLYMRVNDVSDIVDVIHIKSAQLNKRGCIVLGRFNTVLVNMGSGEETGLKGMYNTFLLYLYATMTYWCTVDKVTTLLKCATCSH